MGPELMQLFREQAERFGATILDRGRDQGRLQRAAVQAVGRAMTLYRADAVIVATGASALWLGLDVRGGVPRPRA